MKNFLHSKTIWLGLITFIGAVGDILTSGGLDAILAGEWRGVALAALGAAMVALRVVTTQPVTGGASTPPGAVSCILAAFLVLSASGCGAMSPETKAALTNISRIMVEAAAVAGEAGWVQARAGCARLDTEAAQTACLMGVATAEALAKAAKIALVPPAAAACPVTPQ